MMRPDLKNRNDTAMASYPPPTTDVGNDTPTSAGAMTPTDPAAAAATGGGVPAPTTSAHSTPAAPVAPASAVPAAAAAAPATAPNPASAHKRRLPPQTVAALEAVFQVSRNPPTARLQELAAEFGLDTTKVRTWFNNRKAKEKRQLALSAGTSPASGAGPASAAGAAGANPAKRRRSNSPSVARYDAHHHGYNDADSSNGGGTPAASASSNGLEHTLHTAAGYSFNIDHHHAQFTQDMFSAMRDRIIQLENYITSLYSTGTFVPHDAAATAAAATGTATEPGASAMDIDAASGSGTNDHYAHAAHAAHAHHAVAQHHHAADRPSAAAAAAAAPASTAAQPPARIADLRRSFDAHLDTLVLAPASTPGKPASAEVVLHEAMGVDEFIAVFDEKGGTVSSLAKPDAPGETLVAVDFVTPDAIRGLLGNVHSANVFARVNAGEPPVPAALAKINVLYDKKLGKVTMSFTVVASA
ncbi:hypothetical protein H9P43_007088 [Blastocladiella emersonii ATCC 22665]|nr:hypothetical protein H9P43_007088 [Blastocladiella emersonii ATCC 22665]